MKTSAEVRWFGRGDVPESIDAGFRRGRFAPGGGTTRRDVYIVGPGQHELGIKRRGGGNGVEIKGLVDVRPSVTCGPYSGSVELWTKWSSGVTVGATRLVATEKTRWLRKFDATGPRLEEIELDAAERPADEGVTLPACGCNVELTVVSLDDAELLGPTWWTLGFESFGPLDGVESILRRTVEHLATRFDARAVPEVFAASYPTWLQGLGPWGA